MPAAGSKGCNPRHRPTFAVPLPFPAHMTLTYFKALHQRRQIAYLAHYGHRLAERQEDSFDLTLFAVGDFYAETWRSCGDEAVLFIHVFQKPAGLGEYLARVQLPRGL